MSLRTAKRIVALTISLAYGLAPRRRRAPVVVTYHSVPKQDLDGFTSQMRALRLHGRVTFADDSTAGNGSPSVAVTFDDALDSVFDGALQVMAVQQIPATVFVPTGYMGADAQWRSIKGTENQPSGRVATVERLKALDPRLVRLGSHTVSHPSLASLDSIDLERELEASKRALEALTGAPVTMLSLPYGSYDARVLEAARATGYDRVFANVPVRRHDESAGVLRGRINVSPRDWPIEFRLKVAGAYDWMVLAMPLKHALLKPFRKPQDHDIGQ